MFALRITKSAPLARSSSLFGLIIVPTLSVLSAVTTPALWAENAFVCQILFSSRAFSAVTSGGSMNASAVAHATSPPAHNHTEARLPCNTATFFGFSTETDRPSASLNETAHSGKKDIYTQTTAHRRRKKRVSIANPYIVNSSDAKPGILTLQWRDREGLAPCFPVAFRQHCVIDSIADSKRLGKHTTPNSPSLRKSVILCVWQKQD